MQASLFAHQCCDNDGKLVQAMQTCAFRRRNPNVVKAQYAVRGEIVNKAKIVSQEVAQGKHSFDSMVWCNIGNPQKLGQQPISFIRQILSLCEYPQVSTFDGFVCLSSQPPWGSVDICHIHLKQ